MKWGEEALIQSNIGTGHVFVHLICSSLSWASLFSWNQSRKMGNQKTAEFRATVMWHGLPLLVHSLTSFYIVASKCQPSPLLSHSKPPNERKPGKRTWTPPPPTLHKYVAHVWVVQRPLQTIHVSLMEMITMMHKSRSMLLSICVIVLCSSFAQIPPTCITRLNNSSTLATYWKFRTFVWIF